ncbi:MAG: LptF/LptG family permease [Bacteroidetes bacterium]|nr:LptF/LptG family permease [Bacteroidota bacterium]MDA1335735.1 LptF/LptG family permease [Bacteroidota bacterium]
MGRFSIKRLDRYIIRKFLTTFFFMVATFCVVAVVFDLMENVGRLISNQAPLGGTILYYLSFCFHFGNLLSGFIVFLTIIWFTSRLAQQTEIVAMLSSGMSFTRLMRPYFFAATVLVIMSLAISHYVLPKANERKVEFEVQYVHVNFHIADQHLYREIEPGVIAYFRSITVDRNTGYRFQLERWNEKNELEHRILAAKATWIEEDSIWRLVNARVRDLMPDGTERLRYVTRLDTVLPMRISDFGQRAVMTSTMTTPQLDEHIASEMSRGAPVSMLKLNRNGRTANPFSIYVLMLIGVGIASRKLRGGMGFHLFLAVVIGFLFVFTSKIISVYAASVVLPPDAPISTDHWLLLAAWLPNLLFTAMGALICWKAPK